MEAVLTSVNTPFLPVSRSHLKAILTLSAYWRFCLNFSVILGHFGKEISFISQRIRVN